MFRDVVHLSYRCDIVVAKWSRGALGLVVHEIEDIAVEGEEAFGRRELLGGAGDVALPVAGVEFSEHWVVEH